VQYSVLYIIDEQEGLENFLYLDTNRGLAVVLFEDKEKLDVVAQTITDKVLKPSQSIKVIKMEYSSIEEAAREIVEVWPTLSDVAFLTDSDPFVTERVASLLQEGPE